MGKANESNAQVKMIMAALMTEQTGPRENQHVAADHGESEAMGMLQKSVFDVLQNDAERLIKELYCKYRHKIRTDYRKRCKPKGNYEDKRKYLEERIEQDILYFETDGKVHELRSIKD